VTGAIARSRHDPDAPTLWEQAAAGLILALLSGALLGPIFAPQQQETPVLRLIWPPIYLVILGLAAFRARRMAQAWPAFIPLLLMVVLALASSLWSQAPDVTERRVLALALTGVFAVYLGAVFRGIALPRMLTAAFLVLGVGSLISVFAFPGFGVHADVNAGMWRGLWYEKNQLGMIMAVGLISAAALLAAQEQKADRNLALIALGVCALALLGSQSKTALIMAMLGAGLAALCLAIRRMGPVFGVIAVWCLGVALVGGLWVWSEFSVEILALFGKDPSLTGRTEIWDAIGRMTERKPWLGYGYSAFWLPHAEPMEWIRHETGWRVPSAHQLAGPARRIGLGGRRPGRRRRGRDLGRRPDPPDRPGAAGGLLEPGLSGRLPAAQPVGKRADAAPGPALDLVRRPDGPQPDGQQD